ncbi:TPA: hypothetical protein VVR75_001109 [Streptococcus pneumoniae]|nr:hypothetical protein [Streptococcus pneumoniae]
MSNNVEIIKANPLVTRRNDNSGSSSRRVAAYCRVSSDSDDQKNSYDSQVRHYREYISQHQDWNVVFVVLFCLEEVGTLVQSTKRLSGTVQHL